MNRMKKFASLLLALVMALALAAPALAAETYSITIENTNTSVSISGQEYSAYRLFDVTYSGDAYAYTLNPQFAGFSYAVGEKTYAGEELIEYLGTLDDNAAELDAFANAALAYAKDQVTPVKGTVPVGSEEVTINVPSAGYYLVAGGAKDKDGKNLVAACSLDTTNPNMTVNPKVDAPSIDKKIVESDGDKNSTTKNVGDVVDFKLTSKVPSMVGYTSYTYQVNDTLSAGLTLKDENESGFTVKIGDATLTRGTDYTVEFNGQSFALKITDLTKYEPGKNIVITYSATLNEKALTTNVETNTVTLTYSNDPSEDTTNTTPDKKVYVYDADIVIDKYAHYEIAKDATDDEKNVAFENATRLPGAKFVLRKAESNEYYYYNNNKVEWTTVENADNLKVTDWDALGVSVKTTEADGKVSFRAWLPATTNWLKLRPLPATTSCLGPWLLQSLLLPMMPVS